MGAKGHNQNTFACYEELPYLKVDGYSAPAYIYKRLDSELKKDINDRTYYVGIPVHKNKNGKRISLRTPLRESAIEKAQVHVIEIKTQIAQGLKIKFTTSEKLAIEFLKYKKSFVRDDWEGKVDAGLRSITQARYKLIEGKIRNYFLPFVGSESNSKNISYKKFDKEWEMWRKDNPSGIGLKKKKPKQSTIKDEMGMIREIWRWGQLNGYIEPNQRKPFDYENLIPDDVVRRATFEIDEYNWFIEQASMKWCVPRIANNQDTDPKSLSNRYEAPLVIDVISILAGTGMRTGELFKLKWKDIKFFSRDDEKNHTGALIQVHPSTKTGAREVNTDRGKVLENVKEHSELAFGSVKESDFVFRHLNGQPVTTRWFGDKFAEIRDEIKLEEKIGKHIVPYGLRHFYCTSRIYAGVSPELLADNMGIESKTLKKFYKHSLLRMQHKELFKPVYVESTNLQTRSFDKENPDAEKIEANRKKRIPRFHKKIKELAEKHDIQIQLPDD